MAIYCKLGYLNNFVTPAPEGWGLDTTIKSYLATNLRMTANQVYDAIQADGNLSQPIKDLSEANIKTILAWMEKHSMIGNAESDEITYIPPN